MGDVDKELVKELTAAKRAPRNFAFVNAPGGAALLMSKKKIGGGKVKEKQKECGGGHVIRGLCTAEDGRLIFKTTTNVSDTLSKKLRDSIRESGGPPVKVEFRTVESVEEIDDEREDEAERGEGPRESREQRVESIGTLYAGWVSDVSTLKAKPPANPDEADAQVAELTVIQDEALEGQKELTGLNSSEASALAQKIGLFLGAVGMLRNRAIRAGAKVKATPKGGGLPEGVPSAPPQPPGMPEGGSRVAPEGQEVVKSTEPKDVGSTTEGGTIAAAEKGVVRIGEELKQVGGRAPRDQLVRLGWVDQKIKDQRDALKGAEGKRASELVGVLNQLEGRVGAARQKAATGAKAAILDEVDAWEAALGESEWGKKPANEQIAAVGEVETGIATAKADLMSMGLPQSELKMILGSLLPVMKTANERRKTWEVGLPKRQGTKDPEPKRLADVKAPALTLGRADCKKILKECGNQWNNVKAKYKSAPDTMWQLWAYRKAVVDEAIDDLKKLYKFESMAVGSTNLESDYDIAVVSHGEHPKDKGPGDKPAVVYDFEIVHAFNTGFGSDYGVQPGTLFDTNLYASAKPATDEATKKEPVSPTEKAMKAMAEGGQDVGALVKQRRYMSWEEYDAYAKKVTEQVRAKAGDKLAEVTLKQFEEADDLYQLSLLTLLEKTKQLLQSDVAVDSGERSSVDEDVSAGSKKLLEKLEEIEKKLRSSQGVGGQKELIHALEALEHEHSDLFMRASNSTYVESVKGVRDLEARAAELEAKTDRNAQEELELQGLPAKIKTFATDAVCFANEAYHSEGPMKHVVEATQAIKGKAEKEHPGDKEKQKEYFETERKKALEAMSLNQFLQSFNEQLGDFLKDLKHYASKPYPGMGFYRSSKYLDRLLDAMILIGDRVPDADVSVPGASPADPAGLKAKVASGLLAARKGELAFKGAGDDELAGEALQQETEAYAIQQIKGLFGKTSLDALAATFLGVAGRINSELRARIIAAETATEKGQDKAYFTEKSR